MIWTVLERLGLMLGTVLAGKQLLEFFSDDEEIKPNSIYSPEEIASLLAIEKVDVISMIHKSQLKAWKTNGLYRVLGRSVIELLSRMNDDEIMFQTSDNESSVWRPQGIALSDKGNIKFLFGSHGADHEMRN